MATQAVDTNIRNLIQDLFTLQDRLRRVGDDAPEHDAVFDVVSGYLVVNEPIIHRAVSAWEAASEEELRSLEQEHRELDASATVHSFRDIALQPVTDAPLALASPAARSLLRPDDDELHMLDRVLEYAKYLANTDDLALQWSPVAGVLDAPDASALVERVRAQVIADQDQHAAAVKAFGDATPEEELPATDPPVEPAPASVGSDYRPSATISRDYWTVDDHLGYDFYADAVGAFIQHKDTRPPLTIGIKAPWGAGKTSLMRMIRQRLDPDPESELRPGATTRTISNREVLAETRVSREERDVRVDDLQAAGNNDRRPTVWFNAWMYQSAEQVWAGLADAIISQLTGRMPTFARERFWAQLNLRRVDTDLVRRRIYTALVERLLPLALALVVVWGLALALLLIPGAREIAAGVGITSTVGFGAVGFAKVRKFLREPVAGSFGELVSEPDYKGKAGYMHHVRADMERVLDLVATPEQPVVVFVDDLDRCSYESVAKVIEAINLFLAGEFPNCMFVIAMEPDLVAAQIEVAYKDLFETVKEDLPEREQGQLGWRFLEKMVQLPLSLPPPNAMQVGALVGSILSKEPPAPAVDGDAVRRARDQINDVLAQLQVDASVAQLAGIADAAKHVQETLGGEQATVIAAAEAEFDERFRDDDPVVQQAIRDHATALSRNPREIKRFINVFRFYAFIQVRRELRELETPSYEQLAKLSALAIHWPHLLGLFGQSAAAGTSVLEDLEKLAIKAKARDEAGPADGIETADGQDLWRNGVEQAGFPAGRCSDLMAPDLRALLAEEPVIGSSAGGFL